MAFCKFCRLKEVKTESGTFCSRGCYYSWLRTTKDPFNIVGKRFGKTYGEIYGEEKAKKITTKQSNSRKTEEKIEQCIKAGINTRFKKGHESFCTKEGNKKISEKLRKCKDTRSKHLRDLIKKGEFTPTWISGRYKAGFRKDIGHFVRSSWEANVCRMMKFSGVTYEYESKNCRFDLGETIYICDLFLPEFDLLIEIKPSKYINGHKKVNQFIKIYPDKKLEFIDEFVYSNICKEFGDIIPCWEK